MDGLRALVGQERSLHEVARTIHFAARSLPATTVGALLGTCADETENECAEAFMQGFGRHALPTLKFARSGPFRLANLGARYEWKAVRLAEEHFAIPKSGGPKLLVVKLNSHVACQELPLATRKEPTDPAPFRLGRFKRYGRDSTACGALAALLEHGPLAGADDLYDAFQSEGHDRLGALKDPERVEPRYAPLYAAIVSARLQARKAVLDIQDYAPVTPTFYLVLPCVTINRHERDTEILCGMYTIDGREGGTDAVYFGLGDRPEGYSTTIRNKRFQVGDDELGRTRASRDHRALAYAALREQASSGQVKVHHDERLEKIRAGVARGDHRNAHRSREMLRIALPVLAEVAPIPAAMLAFADGTAGIHHAFRIHKLASRMKGTAEARQMLDEIETRIDELDPDRAAALLELLVADYR